MLPLNSTPQDHSVSQSVVKYSNRLFFKYLSEKRVFKTITNTSSHWCHFTFLCSSSPALWRTGRRYFKVLHHVHSLAVTLGAESLHGRPACGHSLRGRDTTARGRWAPTHSTLQKAQDKPVNLLYWTVDTSHLWSLKSELIKNKYNLKSSSSIALATFQVLRSHMLASDHIEDVCHHKRD